MNSWLSPSMSLTKLIDRPSGDHCGSRSLALGLCVRFTRSVPSGRTDQMSYGSLGSGPPEKTIREPPGAHAGYAPSPTFRASVLFGVDTYKPRAAGSSLLTSNAINEPSGDH